MAPPLLLILITWQIVKLTRPKQLIKRIRDRLNSEEKEENNHQESDKNSPNWKEKIQTKEAWSTVAQKYFMEWGMVWKDVTFGFTVAGIIAAFVPKSFFQTLFIESGQTNNPGFFAILEHTLVGPIAAFFTFIGSMGNIPLASVLYSNGVSFAGVMAFIFSDLVVFPVIRVNAKYYGWKMALYIVGVFFGALVITSILMHYGFSWLGLLPQGNSTQNVAQTERFAIDYTFWLNLVFMIVTGLFVWLRFDTKNRKSQGHQKHKHHQDNGKGLIENLIFWLAIVSYIWLAGGLIVFFLT